MAILFTNDQIVNGTVGSDAIYGTGSPESINDIVYGHAGDDTITFNSFSSLDNSTLYGGQGNDEMFFTSDDVAYGQLGNDTLEILKGFADTAYGGQGNDRVEAVNSFSNVLYGNLGDDIISFAGASTDTGYGGQGADTISQSFSSAGVLYGNRGDDLIQDVVAPNNTGNSTLYGGRGNDTLVSYGAGGDTMYGGQGDDLFVENALLFGNATTADQLVTVGDFNPANDHLSMSAVYGTGGSSFTLDKENESSVATPAEALAYANKFYSSDHAHTFLFIYGGTDNGGAAGYLFYNSDNNVSPGHADDGMILIGDNAAGDVNNSNIVVSSHA